MKIIFFGDSITDSNRNRAEANELGDGYVKFAANKIKLLYPEKDLTILNCGVSGDRTADLLARVEKDVVSEKPDVVVMLAGINDVWRRFDAGLITTKEEFSANYRKLVETIEGGGAKLILIEPFLLNVSARRPFRPYVSEFAAAVREIAGGRIPLIPMDEIFKGLSQDIAPAQFAADGIHPTHRGSRYIADQVVKELKKIIR